MTIPRTRFAAMSAWLLLLAALTAVDRAAGAPLQAMIQVLDDGEQAPTHAFVGRPDRQLL